MKEQGTEGGGRGQYCQKGEGADAGREGRVDTENQTKAKLPQALTCPVYAVSSLPQHINDRENLPPVQKVTTVSYVCRLQAKTEIKTSAEVEAQPKLGLRSRGESLPTGTLHV